MKYFKLGGKCTCTNVHCIAKKGQKVKYPELKGPIYAPGCVNVSPLAFFFFSLPKGRELFVMRWQLQVQNTAAEAGMDPSSCNHTPLWTCCCVSSGNLETPVQFSHYQRWSWSMGEYTMTSNIQNCWWEPAGCRWVRIQSINQPHCRVIPLILDFLPCSRRLLGRGHMTRTAASSRPCPASLRAAVVQNKIVPRKTAFQILTIPKLFHFKRRKLPWIHIDWGFIINGNVVMVSAKSTHRTSLSATSYCYCIPPPQSH